MADTPEARAKAAENERDEIISRIKGQLADCRVNGDMSAIACLEDILAAIKEQPWQTPPRTAPSW